MILKTTSWLELVLVDVQIILSYTYFFFKYLKSFICFYSGLFYKSYKNSKKIKTKYVT